MTAKAVILAAGLGTRLRPITNTIPKCLVSVGGKPLLDYWLDAIEAADIGECLINTHYLPDPVREYIADRNSTRQIQLVESYEPDLKGSAGTVTANRNWSDDADEIVVIYADNLSDLDLGALLAFHQSHTDLMTMALFHTPYPQKCGIAALNDAGTVIEFVEKPEKPKSDLANAGIYVLDRSAWYEIADMNAFDFGFDVIPKFVGRMRGYRHDGYLRDIGTHESLAQAEADVSKLFG